jgi:hypothetical protein
MRARNPPRTNEPDRPVQDPSGRSGNKTANAKWFMRAATAVPNKTPGALTITAGMRTKTGILKERERGMAMSLLGRLASPRLLLRSWEQYLPTQSRYERRRQPWVN